MQRAARDNVRRILEEQEKLSFEIDAKKKKLDYWSKQLNKREALTERERQKLDEEKKQVMFSALFKLARFETLLKSVLNDTDSIFLFYLFFVLFVERYEKQFP